MYMKDYKKACENLNLYHSYNDSIFSQENKNKIAKLESAKDIALKNKEIQVNKLQFEAEKKQKWFYIAGLGFFAILGGLLLYQN